MSVKLRLRRMGKKKQAFYRIVAIDSRNARNGRYIENLGTYNPITDPAEINLKEERALYWLQQGAIPSDTVKTFLKKQGVLLKWHLMKQGADDVAIDIELKKWEAQQIEREKKEEALLEQQKREKKPKKGEKTGEEAKVAAEANEEAVVDVADVATPQSSEKQPAEALSETPPEEAEVKDVAASADAAGDVDVAAKEETVEDVSAPETEATSASAKEDVVEQAAPEKPKKKAAKNSKKTEEVKTDTKATEEEPASDESPSSEPDKEKKTDTDK